MVPDPQKAEHSPVYTVTGYGEPRSVLAVAVAQINATNNRKVFILIVAKTVKNQRIYIFNQNGKHGKNYWAKSNWIFLALH